MAHTLTKGSVTLSETNGTTWTWVLEKYTREGLDDWLYGRGGTEVLRGVVGSVVHIPWVSGVVSGWEPSPGEQACCARVGSLEEIIWKHTERSKLKSEKHPSRQRTCHRASGVSCTGLKEPEGGSYFNVVTRLKFSRLHCYLKHNNTMQDIYWVPVICQT